MKPAVLIFGYGFIGAAFAAEARQAGYDILATARASDKRDQLAAQGIDAVDPADPEALAAAVSRTSGLLITPAPDDGGGPAFAALSSLLIDAEARWIAYLSTTGVYGDRDGGWVWEDSDLRPGSTEGRRRVLAEQQWQSLAGHLVNVFRLPGLYGPGRSVIERLRDGTARRIHKPEHVFSRLHHDDCGTALLASLLRQTRGVFNLCDDEPAPADQVLTYAASLTGLPLPPEMAWDDPALSPVTRRFYADNKRVANARAKAVLGWRPRYPTYREGLSALWQAIQSGKSA